MTNAKVFVPIIFMLTFVFFIYKNIDLQRDFLKEAKKMERQRDFVSAVDYYERVILAHVPFLGYSEKAVEKLKKLCEEKLQTFDEKLHCYETLRAAVRQVESFYSPFKDVEIFATEKIIGLKLSYLKQKHGNLSEELKSAVLEQETYRRKTHAVWGFLVPFSLLVWVGSTIAWIWLRSRRFIVSGVLGYLLWLVSLYLA